MHHGKTIGTLKPMEVIHRRAFTLMELMLVVLIIGLVYGFAIGNMKRYTEKTFNLELMTLPIFLQSFHHNNHVAVICTDLCKRCDLYVEGKVVKRLDAFIDNSAEFYRFDSQVGTRDMAWTPLFNKDAQEEEVCFRYDIFPDGSSTEMMVKYRESVVDFPGYFGEAARYDSLEDASESKRALIEKVTQ